MSALAQQVPTPQTALQSGSVLVLEDNEFQRVALVQVLRSLGVRRVVEAASVDEALGKVAESPDGFDIALCDLQLGDEEGVSFLQRAAVGNVRSFVIVSALNMMDMLVARRKALHSGSRVSAVLTKPIRRQDLIVTLEKAMQDAELVR